MLHFDALFDCSGREGGERTAFTTGPQGVPTHWKQTALYLKEPLSVRPGDVVSGTVACSRGLEYKRAYDISVTYQVTSKHDQSQTAAVTQLWQME